MQWRETEFNRTSINRERAVKVTKRGLDMRIREFDENIKGTLQVV